jgi:uncharacterized protein
MKIILLLLLVSSPVFSASFDCNKAETDAEVMVCATNNLSMADDVLTELYRKRVKEDPSLRDEQRFWIRNVRDAATSPEELQDIYQVRIQELTTTKPPKSTPVESKRYNPSYTEEDLAVTIQGIALIDMCYATGYPMTDITDTARRGLLDEAKTYQFYEKSLATSVYDEKMSILRRATKSERLKICNELYSRMRQSTIESGAHDDF